VAAHAAGRIGDDELATAQDRAVHETIRRLEEIGSPVVTDGEQSKPSFATYPLAGLDRLAPDGVVIPFADGHQRQLPRLTAGPLRYAVHADRYPREAFLDDLTAEAEADIRSCLDAGAHIVQLDFTEARLALKLDPSGGLLEQFIALNNRVLRRFSAAEQARIGVHTCPGGDQDSTHSLDVDYAALLPALLRLKAGAFYVQLASEPEPDKVLGVLADHLPGQARVFVGVTDPIDPHVETPEQVRDRVLAAARHVPVDRLGTCDDCGFSPFADDISTSRDTAFAKIRARIEGTALAARELTG
jgi:5-methyltetrahydropteroyltriglutamate--homocysteine methyltransferase